MFIVLLGCYRGNCTRSTWELAQNRKLKPGMFVVRIFRVLLTPFGFCFLEQYTGWAQGGMVWS